MNENYVTLTIGKQKNIALIAHDNKKAELIAYEDLGAEALRRLEVEDMPLFVIILFQALKIFILANFKTHIVDFLISYNIVLISRKILSNCNSIQAIIAQFSIQSNRSFIAGRCLNIK